MPAKARLNEGDERSALVQWKSNKVNVVPMSDFVKLENDETYELDKEYKVVFNKQKYPCILKFIGNLFLNLNLHVYIKANIIILILFKGTNDECLAKETELIGYMQNESLKSNINKGPSAKVTQGKVVELKDQAKLNFLEANNEELMKRLADAEAKIVHYENKVSGLIKQLEDKPSNILDLDLISKPNLIAIGTCIFNAVGTQADLDQIILKEENRKIQQKMVKNYFILIKKLIFYIYCINFYTKVALSTLFPNEMVTVSLKQYVISMHNKTKPSSQLLRTLVSGIFTEKLNELANNNAESLSEMPIIQACKGK